MAEKIRSCISIDPLIWEMAGEKLPTNRSKFIENTLRTYLNIEDTEGKILQDITKTKEKLNALENKLCDVRQRKKEKTALGQNMNKALDTIDRLYSHQQERIGRNQVRKIAKTNDIPSLDLEDYLIDAGYNLKNFFDASMAGIKEAA